MRQVKIFHDDDIGALEIAVNAWFEAHPEIEVWRVLQSQSPEGSCGKDGFFITWLTVTIFYSVSIKMKGANEKRE